MEQKAKKRLNVIDIIALVVILAAVLFVGYKMMDRGGEAAQPEMVKVTYKVKKEGVPAEMYENSKKHLPSKLMASGILIGYTNKKIAKFFKDLRKKINEDRE